MKVGDVPRKLAEQKKDAKNKETEKKSAKDKAAIESKDEKLSVKVTEEEINEYLDKFMTGDPIEKEFDIRGKIRFTLKDPTAKMQDLSDSILYKTEGLLAGRFPTIVNNYMLALYVKEYQGIDFTKKQGGTYLEEDGFKERVDILLEKTNPSIRSFILKSITDFVDIISIVFSNESVKNS